MEIKPQDTVLIKEWDELKQEYGVDNDGWIVTPGTQPYFLPDMKSLCGNLVKVEMLDDYEIRVRGDEIRVRGVKRPIPICAVKRIVSDAPEGLREIAEKAKWRYSE